MKKSFIKTIVLTITSIFVLALAGCTYVANGSVIQDVQFDINYTVDGENKTINSTLSLYKTFAPRTTDRVIELIKDGFYNNTAITLNKNQGYAVIGGFEYSNDDYVVKEFTGDGLKGEFTNAGWKSKLDVKAGALVMIRDFDIEQGTQKHQTAKAKFAIVLSNTNMVFDSANFCVFGFIDDASLELLRTALVDNSMSEDGYYRVRYMGDRDEDTGELTANNACEYYFNAEKNYFKLVDGDMQLLEYATENDADYDLYKIISSTTNSQDVFVLPNTVFKATNFKLK